MAPPLFADMGKNARDLFNRGFNFGQVRLDTTTRSGLLEIKTGSSQNHTTGKFFGSLDVKYKIKEHGLTISERWNTDNTLGTEIVSEDKLIPNTKLSLDTTYSPNNGKRSARLKTDYKHDLFRWDTDITVDRARPLITTGIVAGNQGFLAGLQGTFDTAAKQLAAHSLALGYQAPSYILHTFVANNKDFGGSVYHQVNRDLELGVNFGWTSGADESVKFGLGAKYYIDDRTILKARVASNSSVALAYTYEMKDGVKLSLSALLNVANLNEGNHKFGIGLEYEH